LCQEEKRGGVFFNYLLFKGSIGFCTKCRADAKNWLVVIKQQQKATLEDLVFYIPHLGYEIPDDFPAYSNFEQRW